MVYTGVYDGAQIQSALAAERAAISRHQAEVGAKSERMQRERMEAQQRGAAELDRMYKRAGRISMSVIAGSIAVTSRAIAEYAKTSADARRQVEQLESATGKFQANLGRDLTNSGMLKTLTAIVGWAGKARSALSGVYANAFSLMGMGEGTIAEKDRLWAADSEAQKNWTSYLRLTRMKTAMDIDAAKERGDRVGAATLEAREWKRARLEEIQRDESLTKPDTLKAQEMVTAIANDRIANAAYKQRADESRAKAEERERIRKEQLLQRELFFLRKGDTFDAAGQREFDHMTRTLAVEKQRLRIDEMRSLGMEKWANQAEIELDFAERIRDVRRQVLDDAMAFNGQEQKIIDQLMGLKYRAMRNLEGRRPEQFKPNAMSEPYSTSLYRSLYAGQATPSVNNLTAKATEIDTTLKDMRDTLNRIEQKRGGWQ